MSLIVVRSSWFESDVEQAFEWYLVNANLQVADAYLDSVQLTLRRLSRQPNLGRPRFPGFREFSGIRSWRIEAPFNRRLIFYRVEGEHLQAWRTLHGARNLRRRLLEDPST